MCVHGGIVWSGWQEVRGADEFVLNSRCGWGRGVAPEEEESGLSLRCSWCVSPAARRKL